MDFQMPAFPQPTKLSDVFSWTATYDSFDQRNDDCFYVITLHNSIGVDDQFKAKVWMHWAPDTSWDTPEFLAQLRGELHKIATDRISNTTQDSAPLWSNSDKTLYISRKYNAAILVPPNVKVNLGSDEVWTVDDQMLLIDMGELSDYAAIDSEVSRHVQERTKAMRKLQDNLAVFRKQLQASAGSTGPHTQSTPQLLQRLGMSTEDFLNSDSKSIAEKCRGMTNQELTQLGK